MNQKCKVCGEPAAGFHFGAFTCEGCKSFFGRSYNNLNSITECKNNGECVINKKNRTACKACRLRKCLLVGMSKSGSRYGRRSNWFKIHCLLQEQQQAAAAACPPPSGPPRHLAPPFPPHLFPALARPRKDERPLLHYDELKCSPRLGSPDSARSGPSPAADDCKGSAGGGAGGGAGAGGGGYVPLQLQSLAHFPPAAFLPPPGYNPFAGAHPLLFPGALLPPLGAPALLPRALLDGAALRHHNNNNNNNDVLLDDHNADSSKRFYLDEVLKSQRLLPSPPELARGASAGPGESGGLRAHKARGSSESPLQEDPMDLSVRADGRGADSSASDDDTDADADADCEGEGEEEGEEEGGEEEDGRKGAGGRGGGGGGAQATYAHAHLQRIKLHPLDLTTRV